MDDELLVDVVFAIASEWLEERGASLEWLEKMARGEILASREFVEWSEARGIPRTRWRAIEPLLGRQARPLRGKRRMDVTNTVVRKGRRTLKEWELTRWMKAAGWTYASLGAQLKTPANTLKAVGSGRRRAPDALKRRIAALSTDANGQVHVPEPAFDRFFER